MNNLLRNAKVFWKRNGSMILTYAGAIGVVTTTVMAVKATSKALIKNRLYFWSKIRFLRIRLLTVHG